MAKRKLIMLTLKQQREKVQHLEVEKKKLQAEKEKWSIHLQSPSIKLANKQKSKGWFAIQVSFPAAKVVSTGLVLASKIGIAAKTFSIAAIALQTCQAGEVEDLSQTESKVSPSTCASSARAVATLCQQLGEDHSVCNSARSAQIGSCPHQAAKSKQHAGTQRQDAKDQ